MKCINCNGTRKLYQVEAKCSDLYSHQHIGGKDYAGYVPEWLGPGGFGDYVQFTICRHCGTVQGAWPHHDKASNQFKSGKAS